ncbi:MAG TPA: DUF2461 domain-containing protein [Methylomirabilota bacterium]|nr:DUF2461 domain-containing protein [Methylomirabilota bacterium]
MVIETSAFTGFRPEAIDFLAELAQNNDRSWFQPRKTDYERLLKEPMEALVAALAERFAARGLPLEADPKRSVSRINRDTRFAKDKSPYKTNVYARFPWIGRRSDHDSSDEGGRGPSGYFNVMPGESYVGGGMWAPEKPRLDAFRAAVLDDPDRVRAALEDPTFIAEFGPVRSHDSLKRVPPGLPPDHPMADLLRYKDVIFGHQLSDDQIRSPELPDILADAYSAAVPVFTFLATLT